MNSLIFATILLLVLTIYSLNSEIIKPHNIAKKNLNLEKIHNFDKREAPRNGRRKTVTVSLKSGKLKGQVLSVLNGKVYAFLGVRYAEPPVNHLRFARPEPKKSWSGITDALRVSPMCSHRLVEQELLTYTYLTQEMSEDCLTVNIWTPKLRTRRLRTVMVWIFGGAFNHMSANVYEMDGRVLAKYGDVIVVTINYRVGALGFLNVQTEEAPGNMGIYDQILAVRWVKDNIDRFGGDPNKLVLFGHSSGAISIGLLMAHNETKRLFSRAIMESGSPLAYTKIYSSVINTYQSSLKYAEMAECADSDTNLDESAETVVDCLRNVSVNTLIDIETEMMRTSKTPFTVSFDGYYDDIVDPNELVDNGDDTDDGRNAFADMRELLTGVVTDEGTTLMVLSEPETFGTHSFPEMNTLDETRSEFARFAVSSLNVSQSVANIYARTFINGPQRDSPLANVRRLSSVVGDTAILCPTLFMADEFVARNKTVFVYQFDYRSEISKFGELTGVGHGHEVAYVFGYPLRRTDLFNRNEIEFSKNIMKIWSHFAKTGKSLPQSDQIWPKFSDNKQYMKLKPNQSLVSNAFPHSNNCDVIKTMI